MELVSAYGCGWSIHRGEQIRGRIQHALGSGPAMNTTTRAHLQESAARIDEALRAQQQRLVN